METFELARAAFEAAWQRLLPEMPRSAFAECRRNGHYSDPACAVAFHRRVIVARSCRRDQPTLRQHSSIFRKLRRAARRRAAE